MAGATAVASLMLRGRFSLPGRQALALLDGSLSGRELAHARSALAPLRARVLKSDLVWEWRGGLHRELAAGTPAIAITRWDKALLLSGLSREAGLRTRQARIAPGLFRTEIG
jgi:hypothetical protein